jgi:hypothetical protein
MTATEHDEQVTLFDLLKRNERKHPEFKTIYAIGNGAFKHPKTARDMRKEGMKKGIPDVHAPYSRMDYIGLYIEMKRLKPKGQLKEHQEEMLGRLASQGHLCYTIWGWESAWEVIKAYTNSQPNKLLSLEGKHVRRIT